MSADALNELLIATTRESLKRQEPDGGLGDVRWSPMGIHCWALCYALPFAKNPYHHDDQLLAAIFQMGDYNQRSFDPATGFTNNIAGWDEWRLIAWVEAVALLGDRLDTARQEAWRVTFLAFAEHIKSICVDMETFDGVIPNHGIWGHATFYRIGQLYGRDEFCELAAGAFERVFAAQTADGCFREGDTDVGMPGTPVTSYNVVSLMAINMYHGYTGDPAAAAALEKGWHWWHDFLFPDHTTPPALDCRQVYAHAPASGPRQHTLPAWFYNKPEIRASCEDGWRARARNATQSNQSIGFLGLQYDKIRAEVEPASHEWPEYTRMREEEACIRRRHQWHAVLCGATNDYCSNVELPLWRLERQSLINLFHEELGLIIGSAHSMIQEGVSTFTFYENGAAWYLHNRAYLKSTPPLDSLYLRYGNNMGVVSVDTTKPAECRICLSVQGELGKRPARGIGHPMTALAARGRLTLRLKAGDTIALNHERRVLGEEGFCLRIPAGTEVRLPGWSLSCAEAWWDFRWPVQTSDPYNVLEPAETVAAAEVPLWHARTSGRPRPTATFSVSRTSSGA